MKTDKKLKLTKQRKVILEELRRVDTHPTADEVYGMVRKKLPHISLGTVYRNLDMLSESGMIQRLDVGGTRMRFDGNTEKHYHVRCAVCGRVEDLPMKPLTDIEKSVCKMCGYEVLGHTLEFTCVCPECRKKEKQRSRRPARGGR